VDDHIAQTASLQALLDRVNGGDAPARELLLAHACDRIRRLARKKLKAFPLVRRWEETDDVLQGVMMRMVRAMESVKPATVREFFAICGTQIRRELIDLKRHHYGPEGGGAHHATHSPNSDESRNSVGAREPADRTHEPLDSAQWTEFHERVELLPEEEREVFNLLWYQELTQDEAASLLGVSARTINRRWRDARLLIGKAMQADAE